MDAATAEADENIVASGTCGENLTWVLDKEGVLTISGSGTMDDYGYGTTPWNEHILTITGMVIEPGVENIGNSAFYSCQNATSVSIPDTVTRFGEDSFNYCNHLASIDIPNGVQSIGKNAFNTCEALAEINIPASTTYVDNTAFGGCSSLSDINVDEGNGSFSSYDGMLLDADGTTLLICPPAKIAADVPEGVTEIGQRAFYNCFNLQEVILPEGLISIGKNAF